MTHASMARENRLAAGITDGLVCFSVGIEDLEQALGCIGQVPTGANPR